MKKLLIFLIAVFNLQGITLFSSDVYKEIEKTVFFQINELNNHINNIRLKEINIALYTSGEFINEKEKLLKNVEENLLKNPKVKIVNYGDVLNGDIKNAYVLNFDLAEAKYKSNLGLKKEFIGMSTFELQQKVNNVLSFTSYKPLNISIKLSTSLNLLISLGILILGLILSFATKKYYTFEIMGLSAFVTLSYNVYFYIFL